MRIGCSGRKRAPTYCDCLSMLKFLCVFSKETLSWGEIVREMLQAAWEVHLWDPLGKKKKWEIKIVNIIHKCTRTNTLYNSARAQLNSCISFDSDM